MEVELVTAEKKALRNYLLGECQNAARLLVSQTDPSNNNDYLARARDTVTALISHLNRIRELGL